MWLRLLRRPTRPVALFVAPVDAQRRRKQQWLSDELELRRRLAKGAEGIIDTWMMVPMS